MRKTFSIPVTSQVMCSMILKCPPDYVTADPTSVETTSNVNHVSKDNVKCKACK